MTPATNNPATLPQEAPATPPIFASDADELVALMGDVSLVSPPLSKLAERLGWTIDRAREAAGDAGRRGEITLWVDHKGREVATLGAHVVERLGLTIRDDKPRRAANSIPTTLRWKRAGEKDRPDRNRYTESSREISESDIFAQGEQGSMSSFSGRAGRWARDHASENSGGSSILEIGADHAARDHASSMRDERDRRPGQPFLSPLPRAAAAFDAIYLHDTGQLSTSGLITVLEGPQLEREGPGTLSTSLIRPLEPEGGLSWSPTPDDRDTIDVDLNRGRFDAVPPRQLSGGVRRPGGKIPCEVCDDGELDLPAFCPLCFRSGLDVPLGRPRPLPTDAEQGKIDAVSKDADREAKRGEKVAVAVGKAVRAAIKAEKAVLDERERAERKARKEAVKAAVVRYSRGKAGRPRKDDVA